MTTGGTYPLREETVSASVATRTAIVDGRLMSLDALRGFDMFWILGGEGMIRALAKWTGNPTFAALAQRHTEHPEWHGFTFYDLIFPLFMFIAGVAVPYSLISARARGVGWFGIHARIIRRGLLLVLLGLVINGILGLDFSVNVVRNPGGWPMIDGDFSKVRFPSVLGRIGLGYMFAALIALHVRPRNLPFVVVGLLAGYWAAMRFIPVPGFETGNLLPGQNVGDYIDRNLLPGRLYKIVRDPEGMFSLIPSIANVLIGVLAGHWLRRIDQGGQAKAAGLAVAGGALLALAYAASYVMPFNKNLWTSSFVLLTGGWSLLLLALFYFVIDVWKVRAWAFFFVVIGANAITAYVSQEIIDFGRIAEVVFSDGIHKSLREFGGFILTWLMLWWLYVQKIFLRV